MVPVNNTGASDDEPVKSGFCLVTKFGSFGRRRHVPITCVPLL